MLKKEIERLIFEYGVKREAIIKTIDSNRVTFSKKLNNNDFTELDKTRIYNKYGALLK